MCPFSHGAFLVFVAYFCIQPLDVSSILRQSHVKAQGDHKLPHPQYVADMERPNQGQVNDGQQIKTKAWNHDFTSFLRQRIKNSQSDEDAPPVYSLPYFTAARKQDMLKVFLASHSHTKNIPADIAIKDAIQSSQNFRTAFYSSDAALRTKRPVQVFSHRERRGSSTGNIGESEHASESMNGMILSVLSNGHIRTKRSPSKSKQQKKEHGTLLSTLPPVKHKNLPQIADTKKDESRRKVKERLSGRREAKAHKQLKADRNAKHGQGGESQEDTRMGSDDESRNNPDVHSTSSLNAFSTSSSSQFSAALSEDVQKVDAKGHGNLPTSSTKHKKVTMRKGNVTPTPYLGLDGKPLNLTKIMNFLKAKEFQRQVNREAQWAYLSLVAVICLMLWCLWYLGGFARCRYQPDSSVPFTENQHTLSIEEVLRRKQQYLPMFNEPEWEDVLFCNRGTNP